MTVYVSSNSSAWFVKFSFHRCLADNNCLLAIHHLEINQFDLSFHGYIADNNCLLAIHHLEINLINLSRRE